VRLAANPPFPLYQSRAAKFSLEFKSSQKLAKPLSSFAPLDKGRTAKFSSQKLAKPLSSFAPLDKGGTGGYKV
jgi:hypothetical protein